MLDDDGVWVIHEIRGHAHVNIAAYRTQEEAVRHKAADQYIDHVLWGDCEGHQNIEGVKCRVAERNFLIHSHECLRAILNSLSWDGVDFRVELSAIIAAESFINEVDSWAKRCSICVPVPHVGPGAAGCVNIEWSKVATGRELYISFGYKDQLCITLLAAEVQRDYEEEICEEDIQVSELLGWVKWLLDKD